MTGQEALSRIRLIEISTGAPPVVATAAALLSEQTGARIEWVASLDASLAAGIFQIVAPALTSQPGAPPDPRVELQLRPDGSGRLVSGGAALAAVGLGLALAFATPWIAIAGFGLMGLGLAAVIPTLFRAAGSQPGVPSSVGIAAVSTMGYAGGLAGPPIIGTVAQVATLRGSLAIILVMLAILAIAGRRALAQQRD